MASGNDAIFYLEVSSSPSSPKKPDKYEDNQ
jgi:hypothetical protein